MEKSYWRQVLNSFKEETVIVLIVILIGIIVFGIAALNVVAVNQSILISQKLLGAWQ